MKPLVMGNTPPRETDFVLIERTALGCGLDDADALYSVAVILDETRLECVEGSGDLDTYAEAKLLADDWAWRLRLPVREAASVDSIVPPPGSES